MMRKKRRKKKKNHHLLFKVFLSVMLGVFLAGAGRIGSEKKLNSIEEYKSKEPFVAEPAHVSDTLVLINKQNTIEENFVPTDLVNIALNVPATKSEILLNKQAAADYQRLVADMNESGLTDLYASSGYRTYAQQDRLYKDKVASLKATMEAGRAETEAARIVAPPGASEHQTGLALDVTSKSVSFTLNKSFTTTPEYKWLMENCHKYGFIVRYQESKSLVTDIIFEPWHLRYVGEEHAEKMRELDMCLEEYSAYLKE